MRLGNEGRIFFYLLRAQRRILAANRGRGCGLGPVVHNLSTLSCGLDLGAQHCSSHNVEESIFQTPTATSVVTKTTKKFGTARAQSHEL